MHSIVWYCMALYGIVWYCWPQLYNQRLRHLKPSFIQYVVAEKLKWSSYEDYVSLQKDKLQRKRKTSGSKTTLVPNWIYNTAVTRGDCKRMGKQGGCIIIVVESERGHWPPWFFFNTEESWSKWVWQSLCLVSRPTRWSPSDREI